MFVGGEDDTLKGNPDEWDRMMRINAAAPMRLIRALAPAMADKVGLQGVVPWGLLLLLEIASFKSSASS